VLLSPKKTIPENYACAGLIDAKKAAARTHFKYRIRSRPELKQVNQFSLAGLR